MIISARGMALLSGILLSLVNGILYSWSVFVLPVEQMTGWTRSETSLVFTLVVLFFALGMSTGGFILKRIGPRLTAAIGGCLLSFGLAAASCASELWQIYLAYGMAAGYGIGMANIVPPAVGLRWFPNHRGVICGIMALSLAFGTLLLGSGLAGFLIAYVGVQQTLIIMAGLVLVLVLPASFFLRYPNTLDNKKIVGSADDKTPKEMLLSLTFWMLWLWTFSIQVGGLMVVGHIVPYATDFGVSAAMAAAAMGVYSIANGGGRLLFGYTLDKLGYRMSMCLNVASMALGLILLAIMPSISGYTGLLLAVIIIALAFGGTIPQFSALIVHFFGFRFMETNIGFSSTTMMLAGFVGPYAGSFIRQETGSYAAALFAAAAISVIGFIAVCVLVMVKKKTLA